MSTAFPSSSGFSSLFSGSSSFSAFSSSLFSSSFSPSLSSSSLSSFSLYQITPSTHIDFTLLLLHIIHTQQTPTEFELASDSSLVSSSTQYNPFNTTHLPNDPLLSVYAFNQVLPSMSSSCDSTSSCDSFSFFSISDISTTHCNCGIQPIITPAVIQQTDHRASNSTSFFNSFRPRIMCVVRNTNSTFGFCFSMSRIAATSM